MALEDVEIASVEICKKINNSLVMAAKKISEDLDDTSKREDQTSDVLTDWTTQSHEATESLSERSEKVKDVLSVKSESKPRKKVSKGQNDIDSLIKENNINIDKWQKYRKTTLMKPLDLIEENGPVSTIAFPLSLVKRLKELTKYNSKINMRTIVANLIVDFLDENEDIIQLMENEYNKNNNKK